MSTKNINFRSPGAAIGNGWCDPVNQLNYADYLYQLGLIDMGRRSAMRRMQFNMRQLIRGRKMQEAFVSFQTSIQYILNITDFPFYFNWYDPEIDFSDYILADFVNRTDIRQALHVGSIPYDLGFIVMSYLANDYMASVAKQLEVVLSNFPVIFYNGQLDMAVPYVNTVSYLFVEN